MIREYGPMLALTGPTFLLHFMACPPGFTNPMDALLERQQSEFPRGGFPRSNQATVAVAAAENAIPAVIDSRYRETERHSGLRLAKSDKQLYFLISWGLFLR